MRTASILHKDLRDAVEEDVEIEAFMSRSGNESAQGSTLVSQK